MTCQLNMYCFRYKSCLDFAILFFVVYVMNFYKESILDQTTRCPLLFIGPQCACIPNIYIHVCGYLLFDLYAVDQTVKDKVQQILCLSQQNKWQGNFHLNVIGNLLEQFLKKKKGTLTKIIWIVCYQFDSILAITTKYMLNTQKQMVKVKKPFDKIHIFS